VIQERQIVNRELPFDLTVAVALPKGDRQRWLVEKATELGVARLVPLLATRSVAQPIDRAISRLRQTVIEASKQCGRNRLMEITPAVPWSEYVTQAPPTAARLFAHKASQSHFPHRLQTETVVAAVGPEGGWTDEECALAVAHTWQVVDLGLCTLRVETAALTMAARAIAAQHAGAARQDFKRPV
jgi:16S rRNA (uracil1498-N3)-methyltransferase